MKTLHAVIITLAAVFLCAIPAAAQDFPDVVAGGGIQFNQASKPQSQGLIFGAKAVDKTRGIYSYTLFRITSITFDKTTKTIAVQKTAETGASFYLKSFNLGPSLGTWDCSTAITGGAAVAGGDVGASASGTFLCARAIGAKGVHAAVFAGPSYSSLANGGGSSGVSYPVGVALFWGGTI